LPVRVKMESRVVLPSNTVYVGRPTRWGNPYKIGEILDSRPLSRADVIILYKSWLKDQMVAIPDFLEPIRGKNLACWCSLRLSCHADVLLELANS